MDPSQHTLYVAGVIVFTISTVLTIVFLFQALVNRSRLGVILGLITTIFALIGGAMAQKSTDHDITALILIVVAVLLIAAVGVIARSLVDQRRPVQRSEPIDEGNEFFDQPAQEGEGV